MGSSHVFEVHYIKLAVNVTKIDPMFCLLAMIAPEVATGETAFNCLPPIVLLLRTWTYLDALLLGCLTCEIGDPLNMILNTVQNVKTKQPYFEILNRF